MPPDGVHILSRYTRDGNISEEVDIWDNGFLEYNMFYGMSSLKEDKRVLKSFNLLGWDISDLLLSKRTKYNGIAYCRAFRDAYEEVYNNQAYKKQDGAEFLKNVLNKIPAKKEKYESSCPKNMAADDLVAFLKDEGFKELCRRQA